MLNAEKYGDEIQNIIISNRFGVVGNKPYSCSNICCDECDFAKGYCEKNRIKWLLQKYSIAKKYRALPVEVEAVQFDGTNHDEIIKFTKHKAKRDHSVISDLMISTPEGYMCVSDGDYIIKGVNDAFYPCKPNVFKKMYEEGEA